MVKDLVVVGSGGLDIVRLIEDINSDGKTFNFLGFLERDKEKIGKEVMGYPVLGNDDLLLDKFFKCAVVNNVMATTGYHEKVQQNLTEKYKISDFPNLVHPTSRSKYADMGVGNIVYENINFGAKAVIGNFNIIYPNSSIGHETYVGDYNLLALNVNIGARCTIGKRNLFANASVVSLGLKLGNDNQVGVGSVLINDLDDNNFVLGNPAISSVIVLKNHYKISRCLNK